MKQSPTALPTALPAKSAGEGNHTRGAWLAQLRQEVMAPVVAIVRVAEMLHKDASERGPEQFVADLARIHAGGQRLLTLMDELLDPQRQEAGGLELEQRLRHELRTPLNHVIGYCDLWLEDAGEALLEGFVTDLKVIRDEGRECLSRLGDLLELRRTASDPRLDLSAAPLPEMVRAVAAALPHPQASLAPVQPGVILVVDDNEGNRELLRRWIQHEGHTVVVAEHGRSALAALRTRPFDAVLLDIIMPEINGFRVLEQIKADPDLRHLPVLMLSALEAAEAVVLCIETGAEDYLPKPFNPVLLRARLNACLEKKRARDREQVYLEQIRQEQARADTLLHVILPAEVVHELKTTNAMVPRRYENVAVLFCDIVGFTSFCEGHPPEYVVRYLQGLVEAWEEIAVRHHVEKIKTIGDAFMAAVGLLRKIEDRPVLQAIRCGLDMIAATQDLPVGWNLRVGIHCGPVVAGVIGRRQYLFDLWGDTVNTAARMESNGIPGHVVLSGRAWQAVQDCCRGESRGAVAIKGKAAMEIVRFDSFVGEPAAPVASPHSGDRAHVSGAC